MANETEESKEIDRKDELNLLAVTWKTTIEVQQHFNEISMKIKTAFVTVVLALFAAQGFLFDKKSSIELFGATVPLTIVLPIFGMIGAYLFYFVDRFWYHRLLVGSVNHALQIEKHYPEFPMLRLTSAIGDASPIEAKGCLTRILGKIFVSDYRLARDGKLHSDAKMELFYKPIIALFGLMFVLALGVAFLPHHQSNTPPPAATTTSQPTTSPSATSIP